MKRKALFTMDDKTIYIYWFDSFKESDYTECLKSFTKNATAKKMKQHIYLILFNTTSIQDFKDSVVKHLELEKLGMLNDSIVSIHLGKARKKKDNVALVKLLLLLDKDDSSICDSQELIDLAKNIKELLCV